MAVSAAIAALLLTACAAKPAACAADPALRAFEARGIGEQWIDHVWIEIPVLSDGNVPAGDVDGRLFVASANPVGAIVPTMIELTCAAAPVQYEPAPVKFAFDEDGRFTTSYSWGSCASCSDCYMRWTFSLDVTGQQGHGGLLADLVLNETFHAQPMTITSVQMRDVTSACTEPSLTCEAGGECGELRYEARR